MVVSDGVLVALHRTLSPTSHDGMAVALEAYERTRRRELRRRQEAERIAAEKNAAEANPTALSAE